MDKACREVAEGEAKARDEVRRNTPACVIPSSEQRVYRSGACQGRCFSEHTRRSYDSGADSEGLSPTV